MYMGVATSLAQGVFKVNRDKKHAFILIKWQLRELLQVPRQMLANYKLMAC